MHQPDDDTAHSYDPQAIEAKWQAYWDEHRTFRSLGPGDPGFDATKPKCYVLDMFPYPSGVGLHVGHPLGYIGTDIVARFKRMTGHNVLHPMGYDAFGLPAEQYAVEHGVHPRITTEQNIENMERQLRRIGLSYDWDRRIATIDPDYYRWTQWIFVQLFESCFDARSQTARPVAELVADLEAGALVATAEGGVAPTDEAGAGARGWSTLSPAERRAVIDGQRLAFLDEVPVNWCPGLGTVLANEEVTNEGRSERGNFPVYRRPLRQWMLRITAYADRLLADLEAVDWPESIKQMQRNWIGRSEGARVDFAIQGSDETLRVFTTRPDTLFGATYMVLAPEHPLVDAVTVADRRGAVEAYRTAAAERNERDRQADGKVKTGVFTGGFAVNPVTGQPIPIWVADYVLMGYGTGAIMAVPGHDQRDGDFARAMGLPIVPVVLPDAAWLAERNLTETAYLDGIAEAEEVFTGQGRGIRSANAEVSLDGLATPEAKRVITAWLAEKGLGQPQVQYKLRDWLFSRQRYWGEPFPILHGPDGEIRTVDAAQLPVELPPMENFSPEASDDPDAAPRPPLGRAPADWREVEIDGVTWRRELNTMPQWAGSCWYYLRYIDPHNDRALVDPAKERYWMAPGGVDLYVGGVEHAVLHLLYARFWHKVLFDLGHVSTPEPFGRLYNQGYIQAYAFTDSRGVYVPADEVEAQGGAYSHAGQPVQREYGKMGKSLKNAVSPDEMAEQYGCDTLRVYEMAMGPLDASKPWSTRDVVGASRFLQRVWRNFVDDRTGASRLSDTPAPEDLKRLLHRTIQRVTEDMEGLRFNTAIAALIELNNALVPREDLPRELAEPLTLMLAPLAPHLAEELWQRLGHSGSLAYAPWPACDPAWLVEDTLELALQVMGKVRGHLIVPADADAEAIEALALADAEVQRHLAGKTLRKVIVVPGRLVNIVAS
ncbi:MAG: leucine--tRNA ligase [Caldilineae bacterium]|nr:leucine--tRNA ligase [Caldilineae bacterium]